MLLKYVIKANVTYNSLLFDAYKTSIYVLHPFLVIM